MSLRYKPSITIPNTGDRFDSFDIHVERFIPIVVKHIELLYGKADQTWLAAVESARKREENKDPLSPHPEWSLRPSDYVTFEYFKKIVFIQSMKAGQKRKRRDPADEDIFTRGHAFIQAKRLLQWYGLDQSEITGTTTSAQFSVDKYARWPYYSAALVLVIERARSTPHEVHVLQERAEVGRDEDLQHHPLVYAVPQPRREGGEGGDAAHREGPADG